MATAINSGLGTSWVDPTLFDSNPIDYRKTFPEIQWLESDDVRKTEEGQPTTPTRFPEFERTLMTLRCLSLILEGTDEAYQIFTKDQTDNKLSWESFSELHKEGVSLLNSQWKGLSSEEMKQAMETALVLGDIGKTETARTIFSPFGPKAPDHDDFYGEVLNVLTSHPHLCPSYAKLPPSGQELLAITANLAHFGHMTHIEGTADMYQTLNQSGIVQQDREALAFELFIHTCDVAGALAHVNKDSSLTYTEHAHKAMKAVREAIDVLAVPGKTKQDAYNHYLMIRASWLTLNHENPSHRVLTRIGAMLRLFEQSEGATLADAMGTLPPEEQEKIAKYLSDTPQPNSGRTPTYMPALLINLLNNQMLGPNKEDRLGQVVTIGLPFIANILEMHQILLAENGLDPSIPLNFNAAAGVAKGSPQNLKANMFEIDKEGLVVLKESKTDE